MNTKNLRNILLMCCAAVCCAQTIHAQSALLHLSQSEAHADAIALDSWKYHEGDNPDWAAKDYDDSHWQIIPTHEPLNGGNVQYSNSFWLRYAIETDRLNEDSLFALLITQFGASEIYVNGRLLKQLGKVTSPQGPVNHNPHSRPVPVLLQRGQTNVIALRFASDLPSSDWVTSRSDVPLISVKLQRLENAMAQWEERLNASRFRIGSGFVSGMLSLLFLMFFLFSKKQHLFLFYALFHLFLLLIAVVTAHLDAGQYGLSERAYLLSGTTLLSRLVGMNILLFMLYALHKMKPVFWWYVAFMIFIDFPLTILLPVEYMFVSTGFRALIMGICLWLAYHAFISGDKLNWLVGILACSVVLVNASFTLQQYSQIDITGYATGIVAPILTALAITIYLALRYSRVNQNLEYQLVQVKQLSEENLMKEHEKREILAAQAVELEKQVRDRTTELFEQKKELQTTLEDLKATQSQLIQAEKMASLGELTAGIAHEIQNPLNFVNNFSEVNKELVNELEQEIDKGNYSDAKELAKDIKDNEEKIYHHGKRADAIVKSMLQHSRTRSGKKEPTDINALCDEYLRLAYHGYRAKDKSFNAKFETYLDPSLPKINVVQQDIGRVILNLINNAFYAVNEKSKQGIEGYEPTVIVSTILLSPSGGGKEEKIQISVKDNGNGIPDSIKEKIFQPFFTTKPTGQGTGLGLSLSYDIIKALGGEIGVESKEGEVRPDDPVGRGSEFIIQLRTN
jgi:two-component system, NtrC family, sensor kinase